MRNLLMERKLKLDWLKNLRNKSFSVEKKEAKDDLFSKCPYCKESYTTEDKYKNRFSCPKCKVYFAMPARDRGNLLLDEGFEEIEIEKTKENPLEFEGYSEKKKALKEKTGLEDAVLAFKGKIEGEPLVLAVMDNRFLMGSMGVAVGEKITKAFEVATKEKLPIIVFCTSGGARMQEGMYSLMQMAKTSAAVKRHSEAGLLYVSCLTNPTTGGVTASFASLGDIILAEPNALIGFAGPRVIEQTMKKSLPKGFQRTEFLLEKGFIDGILKRESMKKDLSMLLKLHSSRTERCLT